MLSHLLRIWFLNLKPEISERLTNRCRACLYLKESKSVWQEKKFIRKILRKVLTQRFCANIRWISKMQFIRYIFRIANFSRLTKSMMSWISTLIFGVSVLGINPSSAMNLYTLESSDSGSLFIGFSTKRMSEEKNQQGLREAGYSNLLS